MEAKIRVEYIDYQGVKRQKTVTREVPDFEEKVIEKILTHKLRSKIVVSVDQQIIEYLDDQTFGKEFMTETDECYIVLNYWIPNRKRMRDEKEEIENFLNRYIKNPQIRIDFVTIYNHMKKDLKGITMEKRLRICLSALTASYQSASVAYKNISNCYKTKRIGDVNE